MTTFLIRGQIQLPDGTVTNFPGPAATPARGDSAPVQSSVDTGPHGSTAAGNAEAQHAGVAADITAPAVNVVPSVTNAPSALSAPLPVSSVFADSSAQPAFTSSPSRGESISQSESAGADDIGQAHYAAYGWHVVPSIGNDPAYADASTDSADIGWGFADAGYATDWFFA